MSAATAHDANPFLAGDAARALLADLRTTTDGRIGDRLSAAIRAVTTAGTRLPPAQVDAALAAIALLLSEVDPALLDGAQDEVALRAWLRGADTELTPGRWLAAAAALVRVELGLENDWFEAHRRAGTLRAALAAVHRLRDDLADASAG